MDWLSYAQSIVEKSLTAVIAAQTSICRPKFNLDVKSYEAGTAFIVGGHRPSLLTAQHLFGPDGGLEKAILWQEMPKRAGAVSCKQMNAGGKWSTGPAIATNGAHAMDPSGQSGSLNDVAAFPLINDKGTSSYLFLAATVPAPGSKVWLIAQVEGAVKGPILLHSATVLGSQNGAMLFAYDDSKINLDATSGAPIVDMLGKVVGLNLGGGYDPKSKTVVGVADDLDVLKKAVNAATAG